MANKNTRLLRKQVRAAGKRGEDFATVEVWRGQDKRTLQVPTARVKGDGVNSVNKRRNSCQRIYLNRADGGATLSLTAHEPFLKHEPMIFPNHRQYDNWEYRRPQGQASA